jgi:hypothetical protein
MVLTTVTAPEPLPQPKAKFIAMGQVVAGIRDYDWVKSGGEDVHDAGARQIAARPLKQHKTIPPAAATLLRVAWQTELAARLGEQLDDPGLRLASLQTLPVQTYYAVFSAARARTHAAGAPRDSHATIHETFAREHVRRAPGALGVQLAGDPEQLSTCTLTPAICRPVPFNPMENRSDAADYVWAALRMARRWRLERARENWLRDRRNRTRQGQPYKNLPPRARALIIAAERPTTLLDFVYELRCGTNYRSIDEYAVDIGDDYVQRFHGGLMHLLDMGLLCYEGQIALYAGVPALRAQFDDWAARVRSVGAWATESGHARLEALARAGL